MVALGAAGTFGIAAAASTLGALCAGAVGASVDAVRLSRRAGASVAGAAAPACGSSSARRLLFGIVCRSQGEFALGGGEEGADAHQALDLVSAALAVALAVLEQGEADPAAVASGALGRRLDGRAPLTLVAFGSVIGFLDLSVRDLLLHHGSTSPGPLT